MVHRPLVVPMDLIGRTGPFPYLFYLLLLPLQAIKRLETEVKTLEEEVMELEEA